MKRSILASGLAISLLLGGAGFSSSTAGASPISEKSINIEQALKKDEVQPMIWAAVGKAALKGAAWGVGYVVGERAAKAVLGDSVEIQSAYDYEDVVQAFDF